MAKPKGRSLAKESAKTAKTREKLKKRLAEIDRSVTPQALQQKLAEIHRWISRNAVDRVPLKAKAISLFDGNQNFANVSGKVRKVAHTLYPLLALAESKKVTTGD